MEKFFEKVYQVFTDNQNLFISNDLEPVRTIDLFRGQTTNPESFEYFETPAIFIAWRVDYEQNSRKQYQGVANIDFHIVLDQPQDTGNIFTGFEEGLKKSFFHKYVHLLLDNMESEVTSKLMRVSDRPIDTGVNAYTIISYKCLYEDDISQNKFTEVGDANALITHGNLKKEL